LEKVKKGTLIKLIATDPMTLIDIPNFCREAAHVIEETHVNDEEIIYIIKKC
jgi:tRNA 2-thiouridine synthesizing protein A